MGGGDQQAARWDGRPVGPGRDPSPGLGFLLGLLADQPRKNCWSIAEHAGDADPHGMQHLLRVAAVVVLARRGIVAGQGSDAGSPNRAMCSGPMNVVISAIRSPRSVSTLIDQALCAPASSARR